MDYLFTPVEPKQFETFDDAVASLLSDEAFPRDLEALLNSHCQTGEDFQQAENLRAERINAENRLRCFRMDLADAELELTALESNLETLRQVLRDRVWEALPGIMATKERARTGNAAVRQSREIPERQGWHPAGRHGRPNRDG